jgi:hypothetical protein
VSESETEREREREREREIGAAVPNKVRVARKDDGCYFLADFCDRC